MMQHIKLIAKAGVSLALITWLLARLDLNAIWQIVRGLELLDLVPVFALGLFGIGISAWKWACVLKHLGIAFSFAQALRLFWIGVFFNNFLPGRTGGDVIRAYGLAQHAQNAFSAAVSVVIDRGLNLIALVAIGVVAFLAADATPAIGIDHARLSILILAAIGAGLLGMAFMRLQNRMTKLQAIGRKIAAAVRTLLQAPQRLILYLARRCSTRSPWCLPMWWWLRC